MNPRPSPTRLAAALAGALGVLTAFAPLARAADAAHPVVVELFQSQGCSSCPPANANLIKLSQRPDVLALSFGVTYWDQLGWKDTFASPQYTARQWDYAHALRHDNVFTPQVVVNGRIDGVGAQPGEIEQLMQRAERPAGGPAPARRSRAARPHRASACREIRGRARGCESTPAHPPRSRTPG